jgi:hypothetical protein
MTHPPTLKGKADADWFCSAPVFFCHTFCVVFCQHFTAHCFLFLSVYFSVEKTKKQRAVPTQKNKAKSHFTPTTTTVPFMPEKKRGKLFNIKSLPLWFKKRSF